MMTRLATLLLALAVPACKEAGDDDDHDAEGEAVEQLETLRATSQVAGEEESTVSGELTVGGEAPDFTLDITPSDSDIGFDLELHSPGGMDLLPLSGSMVEAWISGWTMLHEERSFTLSDENGLLYVADNGAHAAEVAGRFGHAVATLGEVLSTSSDETWSYEWRALDLQTDDGVVSLQPGDKVHVRIDGAVWQVVVISSWTREPRPDAGLPGCPTAEEMLSYEMLRVSTAGEDGLILRPEGLGAAVIGCG